MTRFTIWFDSSPWAIYDMISIFKSLAESDRVCNLEIYFQASFGFLDFEIQNGRIIYIGDPQIYLSNVRLIFLIFRTINIWVRVNNITFVAGSVMQPTSSVPCILLKQFFAVLNSVKISSCMAFFSNFLCMCRFDGALSFELANDHPNLRIIHRKIALILGQWVSEVKSFYNLCLSSILFFYLLMYT